MTSYRVAFRPAVEKELRPLPSADLAALRQATLAMAQEPHPAGVIKLEDGIYRLRVGNYWMIYLVDDAARTVTVGRITRRREDTYRDFRKLFQAW